MGTCEFCGKETSFKFEGEGEFKDHTICPKCQASYFRTNFNSGCGMNKCSLKQEKEKN